MNTSNKKENLGELSPNKQPLFRRNNYILIGVSVLLIIIGMILLSGGGAKNPEEFSPAIFNTRRLVVAPIILLIGYIIPILAIMFRMKK